MINIRIAKSTRCNGDCSLYITFNFKREIVDMIKNLCDERFYNKDKKEWEVPDKKLNILKLELAKYDEIHLIEDYIPEKKEHIDLPPSFQFKTKPYEYQTVGIDYGLNNEKWLLGDEQGLGKTKQVIDIAVARKQLYGYKYCLIICGVNSLKWNWVNEIHTHSNEEAYILGQRMKKNKLVIGSNKDKLEDVLKMNADSLNSYFIITNIETMRDNDIVANLTTLCVSKHISMIAVDEMHKCFAYNTPILTDEGYIYLGDIVENRLNVKVYSFNDAGEIELQPITNWFKNTVNTQLVSLKIQTSRGVKCIRCTQDHKIYTNNRGWVEAKDLTFDDDISEFTLENLISM